MFFFHFLYTQVGSRCRLRRYARPFVITEAREPSEQIERKLVETGENYWVRVSKDKFNNIFILGLHYRKSTPTRPPNSVFSDNLKHFYVFYQILETIVRTENPQDDDLEFSLMPSRNIKKVQKQKMVESMFFNRVFEEGVDFRKISAQESLQRTSWEQLKESCRKKGLPVSGNKQILVDRLTQAIDDGIDDLDDAHLDLKKKDKVELGEILRGYSLLVKRQETKDVMISRILEHREELEYDADLENQDTAVVKDVSEFFDDIGENVSLSDDSDENLSLSDDSEENE